jgi:hypothetical protein
VTAARSAAAAHSATVAARWQRGGSSVAVAAAVAAARHRDVSGSLAAARRWRQRGSETARRSVAAVRRRRQRQRRWRQRYCATLAAAWRRRGGVLGWGYIKSDFSSRSRGKLKSYKWRYGNRRPYILLLCCYVTVLKYRIRYFGKFSQCMNSYVSGPTTYSHF